MSPVAESAVFEAPALPEWLDRQLPFKRYRVDIGAGLAMHVMEQGEGRPVLAVHGYPTWGYLYRRVARELRSEPFRVLMPDLVGFGMSDHPEDASWHTVESHSAALGTMIDTLDLQDLIFVGQDWGGPIGSHALSSRADRVGGMVILNTSLGPPRPGFKPTSFHRFFGSATGRAIARVLPLPQGALWLVQGDRASMKGEVGRAYRYPLQRRLGRAAVTGAINMVPDSLSHDSIPALKVVEDFMKGYRGPAQIVWGMKDPVLGRLLNRISGLLPQAEVTKTDGGHFLQEEVPADIAEAVRVVAASQ